MNVVRVVNGSAPDGSVAIGRGSVWGNPFIIGADGERGRVIAKFRQYAVWRLEREPNWLEPLRGKDLACYCAPNPCHGDVIKELMQASDIVSMLVQEEDCPCFMGGSCPTDYKHEGDSK